MPIWTRDGQGIILDATGQVINCEDCPCGDDLETEECLDCPDGELAKCWDLAVAGVTGSGECSLANGTWVLIPGAGTPNTTCCRTVATGLSGGAFWQWSLCYASATDLWLLNFHAGSTTRASYRLDANLFDCLGSNTLPFVTSTGCGNWPESLTVDPVDCP